jgi:hypothetical protein
MAVLRNALGYRMKAFFVHQNLPGQFLHLIPALEARGHECRGLTAASNQRQLPVPVTRYEFTAQTPDAPIPPLAKTYSSMAARGVAVAMMARKLRDSGGGV